MVSFRVGLKSGAWTEAKPGVASMAMSMLTKGTKTRDAKQMAETLESNAVSLSGSSGMDTASVSGSALARKLDLGVELLADVIVNPTFPEDEFKILRNQVNMGLLVSSKTPEYLAQRQFRQQVYGDHPYARTATGELEDVSEISVADMKAWLDPILFNNRSGISWPGFAVNKDQRALIDRWLNLPETKRQIPIDVQFACGHKTSSHRSSACTYPRRTASA